MAYELRDFSDIAPPTTVGSDITNASTTITVAAGAGYPSGGAAGDFMIQIESELIRCSSRSGNTLTVSGGAAGRGQNGTTAVSHVTGTLVNHAMTAINDAKEANRAVAKTIGAATTTQDILVADAPNSFTRLGIGANGTILQAISGSLAYGPLLANTVGASQITDGSVGNAELATNAVATANIQDSNVTTAKIADANVTTAKLADSAVTSLKIADATIVTGDLADSSVTSAKIVDLTIATGDIADSAITSVKIADGTIATADLADASITSVKNAPITGWRGRRTTNQSVGSGSITTITWPTEDYDSDGFLTPTSGTFTIPASKDGIYVINFRATLVTGDPTNTGFLQITRTGGLGDSARSSWGGSGGVGAFQLMTECTLMSPFAAGDTFACGVFQTSGGALNVVGAISVYRMGHE